MESCVSMLKSVLVVIVLVAAVQSGAAAEELASCCKKVNNKEITEPILGYMVQQPNPPCVQAVIFQTKSGFYCSQLTAPWVRRKVVAFVEAKARAAALAVVPPSPISLLSMITSTASPASSSSLPSSPFTSDMPAAEELTSCCKKINNKEITEPILGYMVQQPNPPCVRAVIFQTKSGFYCSQLTAPWVHRKVVAFEEAKARAAALAVVPPSPSSP